MWAPAWGASEVGTVPVGAAGPCLPHSLYSGTCGSPEGANGAKRSAKGLRWPCGARMPRLDGSLRGTGSAASPPLSHRTRGVPEGAGHHP